MAFNKYQFIRELREDLADEFGCPNCAEEKGEKYEEPNQEMFMNISVIIVKTKQYITINAGIYVKN